MSNNKLQEDRERRTKIDSLNIHDFRRLKDSSALSQQPFPFHSAWVLHVDHGGFALQTGQKATKTEGALAARALTHAPSKYLCLGQLASVLCLSPTEGLTGWHKAQAGQAAMFRVVGFHVRVKRVNSCCA